MKTWQVLVVDDDTDGREVVGLILRFHHITCVGVPDADEALDKLDGVDGVIIDLNLPGMDGWSLLKRIRPDITIILGELPREQELDAMRAMSDYLEGKTYQITAPYPPGMQHGHAYLADVRALHQTVRHRAEGVRVSIDFRFRTTDRGYQIGRAHV